MSTEIDRIPCRNHRRDQAHHHGEDLGLVICDKEIGYARCPACQIGAPLHVGEVLLARAWWERLIDAAKVELWEKHQ